MNRALLAEQAMPMPNTGSATSSAYPPDGQASFAGVVREVEGEALVFDFNHPLAVRPVTFEVQLIGIL